MQVLSKKIIEITESFYVKKTCRIRNVEQLTLPLNQVIYANGPFQRHVCDQKKWKIPLLNLNFNKFLIDNSASCSSQDIQVFEN